jgi:hypothetical protein
MLLIGVLLLIVISITVGNTSRKRKKSFEDNYKRKKEQRKFKS